MKGFVAGVLSNFGIKMSGTLYQAKVSAPVTQQQIPQKPSGRRG